MKIYLAGKIKYGDWRADIVSRLRDISPYPQDERGDPFVCGQAAIDPTPWPVLRNVIFGKHDYVGPYFVSCDHGCFHGPSTHGRGMEFVYPDENGDVDWLEDAAADRRTEDGRKATAMLCTEAIKQCDLLFAWIDANDCFGTLVEIGIAHALGKRICIAGPEKNHDMWFMLALKGVDRAFAYSTPREALVEYFRYSEERGDDIEFDSPIEEKFWDAWKSSKWRRLINLVYQHPVLDGKYRVDFAEPESKIAIELDGYEWHNSKEQFTKDRARQRELEQAGWRFVRFSGSEVHKDAAKCVAEAAEYIWRVAETQK